MSARLPAPRERASIAQRNREFEPYLTIVQRGTLVDFPNHDPVKHHVYSFSSAKVFEIKLYAGKPADPVQFDKSGEVAIGCNIHDWMEAYALVVETPWFAKTAKDGRARIERVPPGAYRLRLWHPRQLRAAALVELEFKDLARHVELTLDVAPRILAPRPAQDADRY